MDMILACDYLGGIGYKGKLPWIFPKDLARFKLITTELSGTQGNGLISTEFSGTVDGSIPCGTSHEGTCKKNCVIMGRKTWESLPVKPLPNRINIVISKTKVNSGINLFDSRIDYIAKDKDSVNKYIESNKNIDKVFVIGGLQIYNLFIDDIKSIYLTLVQQEYQCDTHINLKYIFDNFKKEKTEEMLANGNVLYENIYLTKK